MPDTTAWREYKQVSQALKDITAVCTCLSIKLKKSFSVLIRDEAAGFGVVYNFKKSKSVF
ncbi:hypothetical protein ACEN2I_01935 [Flavobacterium sp. W22_SRS_FK3]|uniref:hypothetical protein n=1 Tax=Flavobacterium sp. W22_SRS_FK3 TaxID=3240275 RepID=UPI003F8DEA56